MAIDYFRPTPILSGKDDMIFMQRLANPRKQTKKEREQMEKDVAWAKARTVNFTW